MKWWGEGAYERATIDGSETAARTLSLVRTNDLIINKIWVRHGSTAIATAQVDGCAASGEFPTFELEAGTILPRWLHWYSKTPTFWTDCDALSRGTSGKNRITPEQFLTITVPLPSLHEQQRIVARIEELSATNTEARRLRQEAASETAALARSVSDSIYMKLGSLYESRRLGDVCHSITDGDHNTPTFSESGVRFIFVGNVSTGRLHFENSKRVSKDYFTSLRMTRVPQRGDILFSAVGATLGVPAIVDTDESFCFQRHIAILKPDSTSVLSGYLWHMLRSRILFNKAWASTTGSAQPSIPLRAIRELSIPVPPIDVQRETLAYLDLVQTEIETVRTSQAHVAAELDALLPAVLDRAFKGEL